VSLERAFNTIPLWVVGTKLLPLSSLLDRDYNITVRILLAELVMHDERVERHIHGVQETLEQTDADYRRMLNDFSKSIINYKDDIFGLEQVFVNATTSGRLLSLQDRLTKKRDIFMENVRISLRNFRKRFDDAMQYLRQANAKFRKSFK
jgi:hypothetical protein